MALMFVTKLAQMVECLINRFNQLLVLLVSAMTLSACATPAHHNYSWFPDIDTKTIQVRVYGIDAYEMDGFFLDSAGLEQQIKQLKAINSINKLLIEPKANAELFEQAVALYIGEKNGLKTYRSQYFDTEEISSAQILAEIDKPVTYLDVFSF